MVSPIDIRIILPIVFRLKTIIGSLLSRHMAIEVASITPSAWFFVAGQANIIFQAHAPFHSPYEGANSMLGRGEYKTSLVGTLFLGAELRRNPGSHTEILYDEESAGGRGI